jgi:hypothetical protein
MRLLRRGALAALALAAGNAAAGAVSADILLLRAAARHGLGTKAERRQLS